MSAPFPRVLMVTGAYYPELSGAGLQCRTLMAALRGDVAFEVLTTTADRALPRFDRQDDVPVHRVFVDPRRLVSKATAGIRMWREFAAMASRIDVVHLHGFSQKSILLAALARLSGKRLVI